MTGDNLRVARRIAGLPRRALAELCGLHPDSIRYWEGKPRVDLCGYAPDLILKALGLGHLSLRGVYPSERFLESSFGIMRSSVRARDRVLESCYLPCFREPRARCGAKTRKGTPCKGKPTSSKSRCKFHGGASTGPRTLEGRARIAEAQCKRWAAWRVCQAPK